MPDALPDPPQSYAPAAPPTTAALPTGTVTFLYTDIEGSTRLAERHPEAMAGAHARHDALLRAAIEGHGGRIFRPTGDGVCAVFATASDAAAAAVAAQGALHAEPWGELGALRARMALHTGAAELRGGDYFGLVLNRVARLRDAAHGGQVLLSEATAALVRGALPPGADLRDLGTHRLRDLQTPERVFQLVHPALPAELPPLRSLDALPTNLPLQLTSFVGRAGTLEAVRDLLAAHRLVTLTGPGGVGKTRLALQVAADLRPEYPDGVWLVELAALADPALVPQAVASAVGVREAPGRALLDTLKEHLRPKRVLLLLDNFEGVVEAAPAVADLLAACPHVKLLVTSRAVLHVYGEHGLVVPPLTLPDAEHPPSLRELAGCDAVRLFIERAQAAQADFALTGENAPAVAELCRRLDGLPLALELAAARVRLLPPHAMLARLERRLPLLTGGPRDAPARHQTLRNTIAWSYDLLNRAEQTLFARLGVFVGGCTLEAAEAVCSAAGDVDVLDALGSLLDQSLLRQDEGGAEPRYVMLETVREYALERLEAAGEGDAVRRRHASFYLDLLARAEPALFGPQQAALLERFAREHGNLRVALGWVVERGRAGDAEAALQGLRPGEALWTYFWVGGRRTEGRRWLADLLSLEGARGPTADRAKTLGGAGTLAAFQGDHAAAVVYHEEALAIRRALGDRAGTVMSLVSLGDAARKRGAVGEARERYEEALALAREGGDRTGVAAALLNLGETARQVGDLAVARTLLEESLAIWRELGVRWGLGWALVYLGNAALAAGDLPGARARFQEQLALAQELGDKGRLAYALLGLGAVAADQGDDAAADACLRRSLVLFRAVENGNGTTDALAALAGLAAARGQPHRALRLAGAAARPREGAGDWLAPADLARLERQLAPARQRLPARAQAAAWAEGQAMTLEQAVAYALARTEHTPAAEG